MEGGERATVDQICQRVIFVGRQRGYRDVLLSSLDIKAGGSKNRFGRRNSVAATPHFQSMHIV